MSLQRSLALPLRHALRHAMSPASIPARSLHSARPSIRSRSFPSSPMQCLHQQKRHGSFTTNARRLFYKHPFQMTLASATVIAGMGIFMYISYWYQWYIVGAFKRYPEEVAKPMRKALYFTNGDLQPNQALKYYKQALQVAEEIQMDPMSDEVMGIKIQVGAFMEKLEQYYKVVEVYERIRADNLEWLRRFGDLPHNKKRRTHVLWKTIQINVKLGEVYSHPAVWDREMAQERLMWAVETTLKERLRRQMNDVSEEEEGPWASDSEIGAALESLAHAYEQDDKHYLSTPLFLQALSLYPTTDCHSVVLMTNLAGSLAQQNPHAAATAQAYAESMSLSAPPGPETTKEMMISNARTWAQKALDVAASIKPPLRTEECDQGCVVALHNLGEFAEMSQQVQQAKEKYKEAVSLARAIGFEEGVEQSSARLRALRSSEG